MNSNIVQTIINSDVFDAEQNPYAAAVENRIQSVVENGETLNLISFTCSTINSEYLFNEEEPWMYVNTDPAGNNLTEDMEAVAQLLASVREQYPNTQLSILIGNTDPYYIYLQQFKNFPDRKAELWKEFNTRWETYKAALEEWIAESYPTVNATVYSWYQLERDIEQREKRSFESEYEAVLNRLDDLVPAEDLEWELNKLQTHFGPGKYFENLEAPELPLLQDWVRRKFSEYMVQGLWIYEQFPNGILLQNEKPTVLRSRMYQPLIQEQYSKLLPIIHPFGIDNSGYQ